MAGSGNQLEMNLGRQIINEALTCSLCRRDDETRHISTELLPCRHKFCALCTSNMSNHENGEITCRICEEVLCEYCNVRPGRISLVFTCRHLICGVCYKSNYSLLTETIICPICKVQTKEETIVNKYFETPQDQLSAAESTPRSDTALTPAPISVSHSTTANSAHISGWQTPGDMIDIINRPRRRVVFDKTTHGKKFSARFINVQPGSDAIFISDESNHEIIKLNSQGDYLATLGVHGPGHGQFDFETSPLQMASSSSLIMVTIEYRLSTNKENSFEHSEAKEQTITNSTH